MLWGGPRCGLGWCVTSADMKYRTPILPFVAGVLVCAAAAAMALIGINWAIGGSTADLFEVCDNDRVTVACGDLRGLTHLVMGVSAATGAAAGGGATWATVRRLRRREWITTSRILTWVSPLLVATAAAAGATAPVIYLQLQAL